MLDAEQFLDRVIAPGNYLALAFKGQRGMWHRFFPRDRVREAVGLLHWATRQGIDCWHAVASYKDADTQTKGRTQFYVGKRTQENAELIRCFWFDADVKRAGDNKDPSRVYSDLITAIAALKPLKVSGFPLPNLWIRSGYGVHFYWVMQDALPPDQWKPYAEEFKKLLIKHDMRGDVGVTTDSARILRPVDGMNFKDPVNPAPCYDMTPPALKPFYLNADVLIHLQPTTVAGLSGTAPVPVKQTMLANAKAGAPRWETRPHSSFQRIADSCAQVELSLAEEGMNDARELWHSMVGLAWFCDDRLAADAIGLEHPKYTPAGTDAEWRQWTKDRADKDFGAPTCARLNMLRGGVCDTCPYNGKLSTPWWLGVDPAAAVDPDELPDSFRRNNGWIEHKHLVKGKKDEYAWGRLIEGDITGVGVSANLVGMKTLHFTFTCRNIARPIAVDETDIVHDLNQLKRMFSLWGMTLNFDNPIPLGRLLMAWIEKLQHNTRREPLPAIGWARSGGEYIGFSIGGVCYRADGTQERIASSAEALRDRVPRGSLEVWQEAATLAGGGHPVTEAAIAIGFAAPLLEFTGETGLCIAIMGKTATGKTSAFRAGTSIYGRPTSTMFSLDDTDNYVSIRVGQAPGLPAYWDENAVTKDRTQKLVAFVHKITQGRDKGRATADISVRLSGEWTTLVAMSSNRSILDLVASENNETDASMLRVFELNLERVMPSNNLNAAPIIARLNDNYGVAGAVYAAYIASHVDNIRTALARTKDWVVTKAGMRSDERFYVAGICSIIVGAAIAKQIKLLDFNVAAIRDELVSTLLRLRGEREKALPVHNDLMMAVETINEFCNDHLQDGVVTKYFKPVGRFDLERGFEVSPTVGFHKSQTPAFQIGLRETLLRISRSHWRDWCATTHRGSRSLVKLLVKELAAKPEERGAIGAGTSFSTPRTYYIEVPLTIPDLTPWVAAYLSPPAAAATNVLPLPLRPVR